LSDLERSRATKFPIELDRNRFTAARSALRTVIASCIKTDPRELFFAISEHGKPYLEGNSGFQFNLTHCEALAGIAISTSGAVGLDCERLVSMDDMAAFCKRICSSKELEIIHGLENEHLVKVLFQIWTRKEAILKAIGLGLHYPLRKLTALDRVNAPELYTQIPGHGSWWVSTIDLPSTHAAACCTPFSIGSLERVEIPTTFTAADWSRLVQMA